MMTTEQFEVRLYELLDERRPLDSDPQLLEHAAQSPECQELLTAVSRLLEATAHRGLPPSPGAELNARVLAELRDAALGDSAVTALSEDSRSAVAPAPVATVPYSQTQPSGWTTVTAVLLTTAAALLVGLFVWTGGAGAPQVAGIPTPPQPTDDAAADVNATDTTTAVPADHSDTDQTNTDQPSADPSNGQPTESATEQTNPPEIGTLAREASDKYRDLARETQKSIADIALLLPGVSKSRGTAAAVTPESEPPATEAEAGQAQLVAQGTAAGDWVEQFQAGLRPLTDSSMGAFTSLLKALPGSGTESTTRQL